MLNVPNMFSTTTGNFHQVQRGFFISPSISGSSYVDIRGMKLNIGSGSIWTLIPTDTFRATVKMWGAGGSSTSASWGGGAGGFSSGSVQFVSGSRYVIVVGQGGYNQFGPSGSFVIGGGAPGQKLASLNGCGGGLSGIFSDTYSQSNSIMIAGGGGGSIRATVSSSAAGGGLVGQDGKVGDAGGGTQVSGGLAGNFAISGSVGSQSGSALLGGYGSPQTGTVGNSGGGGGYFGGGGSCVNSGGGGSGFLHSSKVMNGITASGSMWTQAKSSDPDNGGSGAGGFNANGKDGRVIIY